MGNAVGNTRGHGGYGWRYGLIDMSSNMNPLGTPKELIKLIEEGVVNGHYSHYPTELGDELKDSLAEFEALGLSLRTYLMGGLPRHFSYCSCT